MSKTTKVRKSFHNHRNSVDVWNFTNRTHKNNFQLPNKNLKRIIVNNPEANTLSKNL